MDMELRDKWNRERIKRWFLDLLKDDMPRLTWLEYVWRRGAGCIKGEMLEMKLPDTRKGGPNGRFMDVVKEISRLR